jgi:hypothetical protein
MRIIAGHFPSGYGYQFNSGHMSIPFGPKYEFNAETVESVSFQDSTKNYNWGHGANGIGAGFLLAGPVGALVGGLGANALKDTEVRFNIRFRDGREAHCISQRSDYERALKAAYQPSPAQQAEMQVLALEEKAEKNEAKEARKRTPEQKAEQKIRYNAAWDSKRKLTPEQKAERKFRQKVVSSHPSLTVTQMQRLREAGEPAPKPSAVQMKSDEIAATPPLPVAGWYTNPDDSTLYRWWDGARWTDHAAPKYIAPGTQR